MFLAVTGLNRGVLYGWISKTWMAMEVIVTTLPEINVAPENRPSQKETHLPTIDF